MPRLAIRRVLFAAAATALAAALASGVATASAATAATAGPAISTGFTAFGVLEGVSASSASNAWAVGATTEGATWTGPLTVHWNGKGWAKVPTPGPATADLRAVDALSVTNAWAIGTTTIGQEGQGQPFIVHWNGKAWARVAPPRVAGAFTYLSSISATSSSNVWVTGTYVKGALILRWNGKAWTQFAAPKYAELESVSAVSGADVWAVGALVSRAGPSRDLILHWNGKAWSVVPGAHAEADAALTGVAATSAGNAWTVGCPCAGGPQGVVTSRWNGKTWTNVPVPVPSAFGDSGDIAAAGGVAWATGQYCEAHCVGDAAVIAPLLMRWTGKKWQITANPLPQKADVDVDVDGLAVTSAANAWSVGCTLAANTYKTFILHWNGKTWS